MRNQNSSTQNVRNDDFSTCYHAELQRKFIDLQFKRSELEKQLKRVNQVLFSLGKEMEQRLVSDNLYE